MGVATGFLDKPQVLPIVDSLRREKVKWADRGRIHPTGDGDRSLLRQGDAGADGGALAGAAFDIHHAAEAFHAFAHALQAEMTFRQPRCVAGIETQAVVLDAQLH